MILWARLTWQAKDPVALAAELARRLSVPARPGGLVPGARLLDLGSALLEVRPWIRERPADQPQAAGRLMLEPVPDGEEAPGGDASDGGGPTDGGKPADGGEAIAARPGAVALVGLGWATVELDRAEEELSMWVGPRAAAPPEGVASDGDGLVADEDLGARVRLREGAGLPGPWLAILEPSTEGRAAASLARDDEGPCAIYLRPAAGLDAWEAWARAASVSAGTRHDGPFGAQVLLAGGPSGPHVIVTEGRTPVSGRVPPGTIAP